MKTIMWCALVSMLPMLAAPAHATEAWQAFSCQLEDDDKTEADVVAAAGGDANLLYPMRAALRAGATVGDVAIRDPGCVAKTFPLYFAELERLGMLSAGSKRADT